MTSRDFCYWLQGYFEIDGGNAPISAEQSKIIQKHLGLVFMHEIDPSMGSPEHQNKLNIGHGYDEEGNPNRC